MQEEFFVAEGNFDKSRAPIDLIVIHTTVGTANSAMRWFGTPRSPGSSAHYVIDVDGTIYGGLEEYWTAYHCGNYAANQRSIGIEHADNGASNSPRPDALYTASAELVADICEYYNIPCDVAHIKPHKSLSSTACPGTLDLNRIISGAQDILNGGQIDFEKKYNEAKAILYGRGTSWSKYVKLREVIK